MNCPKCGLQTLADQKFCRSCGASLQVITQPLADRAPAADLDRTTSIIIRDERQGPPRLVLWGFIIMFIGVAIGIIGKKLMHDEIVSVTGALLSLAGMFLAVYPYLSHFPRPKYDSTPSSQPGVLTQSQPREYLPQPSSTEFVSSVTERTTDLLKNAPATPPVQREDER